VTARDWQAGYHQFLSIHWALLYHIIHV